jgi:SAM-dependent methyltransferase
MLSGKIIKKKDLFAKLNEEYDKDFSGWDFSYLDGKAIEDSLPWDYRDIVNEYIVGKKNLLDMGTGGGEFLNSITILPNQTVATEAYLPNVPIARELLAKRNIEVFQVDDEEKDLPFSNNEFELIINRHESYNEDELKRILKKDGIFITQQVGGLNDINLNAIFEVDPGFFYWNLVNAKNKLRNANIKFIETSEYIGKYRFFSIKSIVYYLKCIPWQIPEFSIKKYEEKLWNIYEEIRDKGYFDSVLHRFLIIGQK